MEENTAIPRPGHNHQKYLYLRLSPLPLQPLDQHCQEPDHRATHFPLQA